MKLQAKINGEKLDVEILRDGENVVATIDDREYKLNVSQPEPNIYAMRNANTRHEIFVSQGIKAGNTKAVVGGHEFEIDLLDPKRLRGSSVDADHAGGAAEIKTAMPGKVVRILKAVGDEVLKGEGVIVVEAMKMQNEMKSPKDGVIKEIHVSESDTVSAGDVLVVID